MRISTLLLVWLCITICSCERSPGIKLIGAGDPTWISNDEARRMGVELFTGQYPNAKLVSELAERQSVTFGFAITGKALPVVVVVDRKSGKARFEAASH